MNQSENPLQLLAIILNKVTNKLALKEPIKNGNTKWILEFRCKDIDPTIIPYNIYTVEWSYNTIPSPCFTLTRPDGSSHHGPYLAILNEILEIIN